MTALIAIVKGFAIPALAAGIITGLVQIFEHGTPDELYLGACAAVAIIFAALATALHPFRRDDGFQQADVDADAHMKPLRQPGTAEKTLTIDLKQRGMLLQHGGITPARADQLARKVVRRTVRDRMSRHPPQRGRHAARPRPAEALTETLAAIPAMPASLPPAVAYTPTEPVPVRLAAARDTAYPDWPTGSFAAVIESTGGQDGAA